MDFHGLPQREGICRYINTGANPVLVVPVSAHCTLVWVWQVKIETNSINSVIRKEKHNSSHKTRLSIKMD